MSAVEFSSLNKRDSVASISASFDFRQFTPRSKIPEMNSSASVFLLISARSFRQNHTSFKLVARPFRVHSYSASTMCRQHKRRRDAFHSQQVTLPRLHALQFGGDWERQNQVLGSRD
ncbi:hypothetical protein OS493_040046 [Desmophyllum pertusum]|uniref:Uncharacterized protein n=1 Tax=Desmophyllum pertusum TaxID=174260 RepID=A0A9X0CU21_9CNID|nr:hypothetical protein OS493_040046 [Desmophyllum pertusum]